MTPSGLSETFAVIVVGGGTAGIDIAGRLARHIRGDRILLFEPSETHYYQPLFTLVGGGLAKLSESARPMRQLIPAGVRWIKEKVEGFDPESNEVVAASGRYRYDYLVACPGIQVDFDAIPGLRDALENGVACSNYSERYVEQTWEAIRAFKGGNAIFTFPSTPVKCAGAPQKIMYLAESHFRETGIRSKSHVIFASAGEKLFGIDKYRLALEKIVRDRGIEARFKQTLVAIDPSKRLATFETVGTTTRTDVSFDLLHVTPPMRAPDVVSKSRLASTAGWIDVDKFTLRHVRYPNVFAAGDASSLPTSRTGAAIRKQAPILVQNLLAARHGISLAGHYDGYTSCPLVTGNGRAILAEFDYDGKPCETFPFDQGRERRSMYLLKRYVLPQLYWHGMMRGLA